MLVGIHQLHYLPWLRYFDKIARSDVFIVLDDIQFNKNGWQNRNKIKSPAGPQVLTVPVRQQFAQTLDHVQIDPNSNWRRKHAQSIAQNYKAAPHYEDHAAFLVETYARPWDRLNDLNAAMLRYFVDAMNIDTPLVFSSELNVPGEATERLVNLIKAVKGDAYYSGAYALEAYLDKSTLDDANIELVLQQWTAPRYAQRYGEFIPDLAIIDLLCNCGPESRGKLLGETPHEAEQRSAAGADRAARTGTS